MSNKTDEERDDGGEPPSFYLSRSQQVGALIALGFVLALVLSRLAG